MLNLSAIATRPCGVYILVGEGVMGVRYQRENENGAGDRRESQIGHDIRVDTENSGRTLARYENRRGGQTASNPEHVLSRNVTSK